ncbi:unnamed protein product [Absidia cylindrospora]
MSSDIAWLELYDHQTCRHFYINQETGDWSKDKPVEAPIVKGDPESVWSIWNEETRTTLYYHSKTGRWTHKTPSSFPVVSLSSFAKKSSLRRYLSLPNTNQCQQENGSTTVLNGRNQTNPPMLTPSPIPPPLTRGDHDPFAIPSHKSRNTIDQSPASPKTKKQDFLMQTLKKKLTVSLPPLSIVCQQPSHEPPPTSTSGTSTAHLHRPCTSPKIQAPMIPLSPPWSPLSASASSLPSSSSPFSHVSPVSTLPSPITPLSPDNPSRSNSNNDTNSDNNKNSSYGNKYVFDHYAAQHFTVHKQGFFRRTPVSLTDMSTWTKVPINKPLLRSTNKKYTKDAITCFKKIQKVMNDRPRKYHGRTCTCDDVTDIQSILLYGITKGQQFRDEIYVQLCKQLNHNPTLLSSQKGWELFSVLCSAIPPSHELALYLTQFIHDHLITTPKSSSNYAVDGDDASSSMFESYLNLKMNRICQQGPRGKVLSRAEIQLARMVVFQQQTGKRYETSSCFMFGTPLAVIMKHQHQHQQQQQQQQQQYVPTTTAITTTMNTRRLKVPQIVPFLVHAIHQLHGHATQGIFRVPGLADLVTSLRIHIENGCDMHELDLDVCCGDPNVPASLLRLWLRELPSSLIPVDYYDKCIDQASDLNAVMTVVDCLPDVNRRILLYIIGFIQEFLTPEVCQLTLMTVNNLAMVFAPNFLRGPLTDDLELALQKSKYEQLFVKTLLLGPKVDMDLQLYG